MTKITEKTESAKNKLAEKRSFLCQITAQARTMRDEKITFSKSIEEANLWASKPLNYYITNYLYQNSTEKLTFKTFNDWKKDGATVLKGSKAYVIWGQPLKKQKNEKEVKKTEKSDDTENLDFFPLCYVFSSEQVYFNSEKPETTTKEKKQETETAPIMDLDNYL